MRIVFLSQYFPPEPGAPAARVSELARSWQARGHDVEILTGMPNHPTGVVSPPYRGRWSSQEMFGDVRVDRSWMYTAPNRGRVRRSLAYVSFAAAVAVRAVARRVDADVLIATSPQFLCALSGYAITAFRNLPFVFEVRDLWPESIVAVGAMDPDNPIIRLLTSIEEHLYARADAIVVVTDSFRERLIGRGVPAEKIHVVKNGVDLARFNPRDRWTALRERCGFGDRIVVGYVGTHGMAHGLDAVLDVARTLRDRDDIRFLFVGDGAERDRLVMRARDEGLSNVVLMPSLSRDAMPEVYATSDICLVPLRGSELFTAVIPSKIFEILAMERPIILSVDGEARRIVERSKAGVFAEPENVAAIGRAICDMADSPANRTAMGRVGREFVVREFDREVLAGRYMDILEGVVRRHAEADK